MAKRQFRLSEVEIAAFRQAEQETRDVYELKRLQAVRLYGSGMSGQSIEALVGCVGRSVRVWTQRYQESGLSGLRSRWQGENALKLSREQRADLKVRLHEYRPDQVIGGELRIRHGQFWTVSDLQIVVEHWYGVRYAKIASYRRLLHECGLSYQRTEKVYRSRPDVQTVADFQALLEKK